ncbi:MAG TPA: HD domain-containing protein, partial [Chthoniobacteraceae bacterium]|nr:HD domain-containing protein [Chthoniobacteraceae bacterium]
MNASLIPRTSGGEIDWPAALERFPCLRGLAETPQEAHHHAEGDVLTHTRMVCDEAFRLARGENLAERDTERLLFAAAFHDVGKQLTLTFD